MSAGWLEIPLWNRQVLPLFLHLFFSSLPCHLLKTLLFVGTDVSLILCTLVYVKKSRLLDTGKIISLRFCVGLHFLVGSKELTRFVSSLLFFL